MTVPFYSLHPCARKGCKNPAFRSTGISVRRQLKEYHQLTVHRRSMSTGNGEDSLEIVQTRRRFLTTLSLAGAASLLRLPRALAVEDALETMTVRLVNDRSICIAPEYMAEELLRAEGFTDIHYVEAPGILSLSLQSLNAANTCLSAVFWSPAADSGTNIGVLMPAARHASTPSRTFVAEPNNVMSASQRSGSIWAHRRAALPLQRRC